MGNRTRTEIYCILNKVVLHDLHTLRVCVRVCVRAYVRVCVCGWECLLCVFAYVCSFMRAWMCGRVCGHICMCVRASVRVRECVYVLYTQVLWIVALLWKCLSHPGHCAVVCLFPYTALVTTFTLRCGDAFRPTPNRWALLIAFYFWPLCFLQYIFVVSIVTTVSVTIVVFCRT